MREMGAQTGVGPAEGPRRPASPGNGATRVLCSLTSKRESGHDISTSDRAGARHQGSRPAARRTSGAMAHCLGDLVGDAHRQGVNVLMLDRKCERLVAFLLGRRAYLLENGSSLLPGCARP
jgi:hypothetical protein